MNIELNTTSAQLAEQAGYAVAQRLVDALFVARNQGEAARALAAALNSAFNGEEEDVIVVAVADGFSSGIVHLLERGIQAVKAG